jgi:hypothetical protein
MTEDEKKRREEIEAFSKLIEEGVNKRGLLDDIEIEAEQAKREFGHQRVAQKLAALPPESGEPKPCPRCGRLAKVRAKDIPRTFEGMNGTHTYVRNQHYCEYCKASFFPRDEELGILKGAGISNEVAKRVLDFSINVPFEACEERWEVHYPLMPLSANQFRQVGKRLAQAMEGCDEGLLESSLQPPSLEPAKVLYVQNDGAMVSMQNGEWREVKSAVMFNDDEHLRGSEKVRGEILKARYVSVLGSQEEFQQKLKPALKVINAISAAVIIWLADGAKGNWSLASLLCPRAIQILDWFHAIEHASDCAKQLFGDGDACVELFRQRIQNLLLAGDVKRCIRELLDCVEHTEHPWQVKAINDLVGYYRSNQKRMRYDVYVANGWLIGSGAIESAHRHVIQARMKLAGQHWGELGGRRMARMRAAYRTAGPKRFFDAVHWAHRETASGARVPKPMKRRASNR